MRVVPGRKAPHKEAADRSAVLPPLITAAPHGPGPVAAMSPTTMLALQRTAGNAAAAKAVEMQRHVHSAGCGHGETETEAEVASVQRRSAVHDVLRTPGQPLESGKRARLEGSFGEDLSSVRLHTDGLAKQSAAEIGALAYTSGEHVVLGEGGQDSIEHEVTHVIQQRRGGVAGTDNGQGLSLSHPSDSFEREAEANAQQIKAGGQSLTLQRSAASSPASGTAPGPDVAVQRYVEVQPGAANYPTKHRRASIGSNKSADSDDHFFTSQQEQGGSYFADAQSLTPNLTYNGSVPLRFSDSYDLAIEQGPGESKVFFATRQHIDAANEALGGRVRLRTGSRYLRVQGEHGALQLHQVKPVVENKAAGVAGKLGMTKKTAGLSVLTPQRCNEMAEFVTGRKGLSAEGIGAWENFLARVLDLVDGGGDEHLEGAKAAFQKGVDGDQAGYLAYSQGMARKFQDLQAANSPDLEQALRQLGLNQFLPPPTVGSALVTVGYGDAGQESGRDRDNTFEYHFGSTVATSGNDYVTMENYARRDPGVGNATASGGDPLFFFKMYGTRPTAGDTWHGVQTATNGFIGAILSITLSG
ncbi:DUF4157 domain-containing protein [Streptomyces sp. NBC_00658]|uniref:eCIS core domain-containing protein n=1 Tax=Streptomyces sp. NBC_00658 TaxID=2975800 RepID=UPI0032542CD9